MLSKVDKATSASVGARMSLSNRNPSSTLLLSLHGQPMRSRRKLTLLSSSVDKILEVTAAFSLVMMAAQALLSRNQRLISLLLLGLLRMIARSLWPLSSTVASFQEAILPFHWAMGRLVPMIASSRKIKQTLLKPLIRAHTLLVLKHKLPDLKQTIKEPSLLAAGPTSLSEAYVPSRLCVTTILLNKVSLISW